MLCGHRLDQRQRPELEEPGPLERYESSACKQALDILSRAHLPPGDCIEHAEPTVGEVIRQHEPSFPSQNAGRFRDARRLVHPVVERDGADDEVELCSRERKRFRGRHFEAHVRARADGSPGDIDHRGCRVDADEVDRRWKALAERTQQRTCPAADVEDRAWARHCAKRRLDSAGDDARVEFRAPPALV